MMPPGGMDTGRASHNIAAGSPVRAAKALKQKTQQKGAPGPSKGLTLSNGTIPMDHSAQQLKQKLTQKSLNKSMSVTSLSPVKNPAKKAATPPGSQPLHHSISSPTIPAQHDRPSLYVEGQGIERATTPPNPDDSDPATQELFAKDVLVDFLYEIQMGTKTNVEYRSNSTRATLHAIKPILQKIDAILDDNGNILPDLVAGLGTKKGRNGYPIRQVPLTQLKSNLDSRLNNIKALLASGEFSAGGLSPQELIQEIEDKTQAVPASPALKKMIASVKVDAGVPKTKKERIYKLLQSKAANQVEAQAFYDTYLKGDTPESKANIKYITVGIMDPPRPNTVTVDEDTPQGRLEHNAGSHEWLRRSDTVPAFLKSANITEIALNTKANSSGLNWVELQKDLRSRTHHIHFQVDGNYQGGHPGAVYVIDGAGGRHPLSTGSNQFHDHLKSAFKDSLSPIEYLQQAEETYVEFSPKSIQISQDMIGVMAAGIEIKQSNTDKINTRLNNYRNQVKANFTALYEKFGLDQSNRPNYD
ncbi:hypothetical protein HOH87_01915 [bacterium]|jgi:hypothetical protein|nr:hypothetical protein [bacterium]